MRYLVTGASRGIGLEFSKQLVARGEQVLATARRPAEAAALRALAGQNPGRLTMRALDVTDPESVAALKEALDGAALEGAALDVVLNNAGAYPEEGPFGEMDYDRFRSGFEINAIGPLRVAEATLPALLRGSRKLIVNVTSKMGSVADNSSGGAYAYRMSKAALNMATRSLAHDLRPQGVVTFVLHPGWVVTDMGGPNALITAQQSVAGMLRVIDGADAGASGRFWAWDGSEVPW